MKKACVIIPAYNEEKTLDRCLQSVLANTYSSFEVVVVDDGSNDATWKTLRRYRHRRVRGVRNKARRGPAYCRNLALSATKAEFVFFTDADCWVDENWISEGVRSLEKRGVVGVEGSIFSDDLEPSFRSRLPVNPFYPCRQPSSLLSSPGRDFAAGNLAFRKAVLDRLGGFRDGRYPNGREDTDLARRVKRVGKIDANPKMKVTHGKAYWTLRTLIDNARRYEQDVVFLKDHGSFHLKRGFVLHPRFLAEMIFPPLILKEHPFRTLADVKLLPSYYAYLVMLRLRIWKRAARERVWVV